MVAASRSFAKSHNIDECIDTPGESDIRLMVDHMRNFKGGPNDRSSDGMTKSIFVCRAFLPETKEGKKVYNKLLSNGFLRTKKNLGPMICDELEKLIPSDYNRESTNSPHNMRFWLTSSDNYLMLVADFVYFDYVDENIKIYDKNNK